ncbi:MAG: hypothetical protein J5I65_14705 [Aridibacter famidurans]|nr:hypothetical protein [Aridibacter famidurans]
MSNALRLLLLIFTAASIAGWSACSSASEPENTDQAMVPKEDANGNPYNTVGNRRLVPYNGVENIDKNTTLDNSKVTVIDTNKIDTVARKQNLPDDSEMATLMNKQGHVVETRTFLKNKYLDKVVKTTFKPKEISIKIYLKSGKVVEVTEDKIGNFRTASARALLDAAGFVIPVDPNEPQKDPAKKSGR